MPWSLNFNRPSLYSTVRFIWVCIYNKQYKVYCNNGKFLSVNFTILQLDLGVFAEIICNIYTIYFVYIHKCGVRIYVNLYVV